MLTPASVCPSVMSCSRRARLARPNDLCASAGVAGVDPVPSWRRLCGAASAYSGLGAAARRQAGSLTEALQKKSNSYYTFATDICRGVRFLFKLYDRGKRQIMFWAKT